MRVDVPQFNRHWPVLSHRLIASFFLGPVKNSRGMSFGIISLTTSIFCASSTVLNWSSYSATFSDHAGSLSFRSFASLHLLGNASMGCTAVAGSFTFDDLGAQPSTNACHATGSCCAFCRVGQGHCWLTVQLDMLVVFSVTAVSPRLRRSERSLRDPLNQLSSLMCRVDISQPRRDLACKASNWCAA